MCFSSSCSRFSSSSSSSSSYKDARLNVQITSSRSVKAKGDNSFRIWKFAVQKKKDRQKERKKERKKEKCIVLKKFFKLVWK